MLPLPPKEYSDVLYLFAIFSHTDISSVRTDKKWTGNDKIQECRRNIFYNTVIISIFHTELCYPCYPSISHWYNMYCSATLYSFIALKFWSIASLCFFMTCIGMYMATKSSNEMLKQQVYQSTVL